MSDLKRGTSEARLASTSLGSRWLGTALVLTTLAASCTDEVNGAAPSLAAKVFVARTFTLPISRPLAYVSNTGSDALTVVDLMDMSLVARLPIGRDPIDRDGPGALAFDAARHLLYVALTEPTASTFGPHSATAITKSGYIAAVNADNLAVLALWPVGRSPASLALAADGASLWVSHSDGVRAGQLTDDITVRRSTVGRFSALPAALMAGTTPTWDVLTVCVLPEGVALDEARGQLGVACSGEDKVAFVDTASLTVTSLVSVVRGGDLAKPVGLTFSPSRAIWTVANRVARDVTFLPAGTTPTITDRPEVDGFPSLPSWSTSGKLFVPMTGPDEIDVLDGTTHDVWEKHPFEADACVGPRQVVESPGATGGALLVLCQGDSTTQGRLLELDPATFAVRRGLQLESYANSLVVRQP